MDEVDVDNVEDINDLEARLYARIHHESKDADEFVTGSAAYDNVTNRASTRVVTATSVVNKYMGKATGRYWHGDSTVSTYTQKPYQENNPIKNASIPRKIIAPTTATEEDMNIDKIAKNTKKSTKTPGLSKSSSMNMKKNTPGISPKEKKDMTFKPPKPQDPTLSSNIRRTNQNLDKSKKDTEFEKNYRFNPASKKQNQNKGLFGRQMQKLQKAECIKDKRRKSKLAKSKSKQLRKSLCTITLESSDESTDDDVVAIPIPPPPTYTIEDSEEEHFDNAEKVSDSNKWTDDIENNAQDANDLAVETRQSVVKTKSASVNEKQVPQNNSRCTSPSSIISSDDFIGQTDRCRLLEDSAMADDEDLIVLTADVDSLMEAPKKIPQQNHKHNTSTNETSNEMQPTELQLIIPLTDANKNQNQNQYRVELSEFRALDVYESESDKDDNVYTRGRPSNNGTIIRVVESSSDDDNIQSVAKLPERLKHLHKRHSGCNKQIDRNNDEETAQSDNDGITATPVGCIVQGPAVERCKKKSCSILQPSKKCSRLASTGDGASVGQMSDSEFIATINTLAQAGTDELEKDANRNESNENSDDDDDSDNAAVPSARTIAEQVLAAKNKKKSSQTLTTAGVVTERRTSCASEDETPELSTTISSIDHSADHSTEALPDSLCGLNNLFNTIDNLDRTRNVSDSYDSEYDVEILEPVNRLRSKRANTVAKIKVLKMNKELSDPIYNIVYSEEKRFGGGLGWNDEMRRFYNNSWKGENFNVRRILSQMNPDKNLWKIYAEDRFPQAKRFSNQKCYNCCEFGHIRSKCTRPRKPLVCFMCGEFGHHEPRCPNTVCLRCGNKTHVYTKSCNACSFQNRLTCPVCKVRGHTLNHCPDKWRRYHSTTLPNIYPISDVEYNRKKFCCICAGHGHLSDTCKSAVRFFEYPPFSSNIRSHQKSYTDQPFRCRTSGIGYNLLYRPDDDISFELAENTTNKNYYGRFLESVGMTYLLNRKRKASPCKIPMKRSTPSCSQTLKSYEPINPQSREQDSNTEDASAPEQVPEISESGNVDNIADESDIVDLLPSPVGDQIIPQSEEPKTVDENLDENDNTEQQIEAEAGGSNEELSEKRAAAFKKPAAIEDNVQAPHTSKEQPEQPEVVLMDSDSNYSFSEHFETPPTPQTTPSTEPISKPRSCEIEPMPDFIPLSDENSDDSDDDDDDMEDLSMQAGISSAIGHTNIDTDEHDDGRREDRQATSSLTETPSEAKIYLTHFHSKYLLSEAGHEFLLEMSKICDIKARLDWTSVGYVLNIFGLQSNQDNFHRELLLKYRELIDKMNKTRLENIPKVPRRADVLIRFLRENINQLMTNLGNVNEHLKRLKILQDQQQHSKSGWKMAEKLRRTLNMILVGQAGLHDGNIHLDNLLLSLKKLINDYKDEDIVSTKMRDEVAMHWKYIFTSYEPDNYQMLVQNYNKMLSKNRIPKLNIDPRLLGTGLIDVNLTKDQKQRLEKQPSKKEKEKRNLIVPNPFSPKNSAQLKSPQSSSKPAASAIQNDNRSVISSYVPPTNSLKLKNFSTAAPFMSPQQKSTASVATRIKEVAQKWENTCDSLLKEIDIDYKRNKRNGPDSDCKTPSIFWSRESLKYLDQCIQKANGIDDLAEKLQRVLRKSRNGQLSYNDYRAIIRIHNVILGE